MVIFLDSRSFKILLSVSFIAPTGPRGEMHAWLTQAGRRKEISIKDSKLNEHLAFGSVTSVSQAMYGPDLHRVYTLSR